LFGQRRCRLKKTAAIVAKEACLFLVDTGQV